jgi:hypothetical protein
MPQAPQAQQRWKLLTANWPPACINPKTDPLHPWLDPYTHTYHTHSTHTLILKLITIAGRNRQSGIADGILIFVCNCILSV